MDTCQTLVVNEQKILRFKSLKSTNLYLQQKLQEGDDIVNQVVMTDYQTAGKGLDNNRWESEPGMNLLFSMALDVSFLEAENQFRISQAVSLGIINVLKKYLPKNSLYVKWPNDVYYSDKKIVGMLINNTLSNRMMDVSIVGIGVNVNQVKFGDDLPNPISMKIITDSHYDLMPLLVEFIDSIRQSVSLLKSSDGVKMVEESYIRHLYRYGKKARYQYKGKIMTLMIVGFDKFGRLQLQDEMGKIITCDLKEIKFLMG